jgi:hypothetical protein
MTISNPTMKARFESVLASVLPAPVPVQLENAHMIGPFDNAGFTGLETAFPPEKEINLHAAYSGKDAQVQWQRTEEYDGAGGEAVLIDKRFAPEKETAVYLYAEIAVGREEAMLAVLSLECSGIVFAWFNGMPIISPTIPPEDLADHTVWIALQPGQNTLLVKGCFSGKEHKLGVIVKGYGSSETITMVIRQLANTATEPGARLLAQMTVAEVFGNMGDAAVCRDVLQDIRDNPYATSWDVTWADAIERQYNDTGHFAPFHDVAVRYQPVTDVQPYPEFWPQSGHPEKELLVVDVSGETPQVEFALAVLQGLVNRTKPRLYLLHTRYARQDHQWLDELQYEGFTWRSIAIDEAWRLFKPELSGAVIYDGDIMNEIGMFHSDRLNQTNIVMMLGSLHNAVPLTAEMNATLDLPVLFDARNRWATQYDMMRWAYLELFPKMNQRILATNYPGIFLITDYLVAFKIFTFWFPEHRTIPEENLLRGILASTPPNSPILGWWFDWMPNVPDGKQAHADAVMEGPGLLRGSYFGKILTPSHEATNLTVHSGVPSETLRHKEPFRPVYDPTRIYYTFMISDGDNLGEALMMRTRDIQWDKPERGTFPMGWSFAPACSHLAPTVLNYYLRTASSNDLLMGGLGVGYTEPMIYLRAFPQQREELWAQYARATDRALSWIDTSCLWLIDGRHEEGDRYARGSSGQLKGIFIGYGGAPDIAEARVTHNNVIAFYSATGFMINKNHEEQVQQMVDDIRAATRSHPDFIEAWVLNWGLEMDTLQQVQERLGPDYVCVRPDVLVDLRLQAAAVR